MQTLVKLAMPRGVAMVGPYRKSAVKRANSWAALCNAVRLSKSYEMLGGHVNWRFQDLMLKVDWKFWVWPLHVKLPRVALSTTRCPCPQFSHSQAFRIVQHVGVWAKDDHNTTRHACQHVTTDSHRHHRRYGATFISLPSDPVKSVSDPIGGCCWEVSSHWQMPLHGGSSPLLYSYARL